MYAIIESGGKQYKVAPGDVIHVDTVVGDVGTQVELADVKAVVTDGKVEAGEAAKPARIKATISGHGRGDKVIVFKFKRKKQYKKTIGHRHNYTTLTINEIVG